MNNGTNLALGRIYGYMSPDDGNQIVNAAFASIEVILSNTGTTTIPDSGTTSGSVGDFVWDDNYLYSKTNIGWGRVGLDYNF